ncbi:MAG: hypothetical protein ACP5XB_25245 [Isosphaeraceae bacterium]
MLPAVLSMVLSALPGQLDRARSDVQLLLDTISSLQQPLEDFRCEFEGTRRYKGKIAEYTPVGEDGLHETFRGIFVWTRGGDVSNEVLTREVVANQIEHESVVLRSRHKEAEEYRRYEDIPPGRGMIQRPKEISLWLRNSMASIFLIDKVREDAASETKETSVSDDQIDNHPLKVLTVRLRGVPNSRSLFFRYWIDLQRSGQVVRRESYAGNVMSERLDIKLRPFKIGGAEVWMPVSGEDVGYVALENNKTVLFKDPTSIKTIYAVGGTMEFNKHPRPEVFTIKYKLGTPISDNLRKVQYEFGQQKIQRLTKPEVEKMLKDQLAQAEKQKSTLVVAQTLDGSAWYAWLPWGFAALVVISLGALWIQRRGR